MHWINTFLKLSIVVLLQFSCCIVVYSQYKWSFEKTAEHPLNDDRNGMSLQLTSHWNQPEWVQGIKGTGLRTDGYSTWLTGRWTEPLVAPVSIGGWFALESYPTDTAGFFALYDDKNENSVLACVDRFGTPLLGVKLNGQMQFYACELVLPKFKWIHVGVNIRNDKAELYINGVKQRSVSFEGNMPMKLNQMILGKDTRQKSIGIFPVTAINGIIDEVELSSQAIDTGKIRDEMKKASTLRPRLAIPESRFQNDFNRPQYHLLPAANWTNETHGLIYYKGRYHIFNQKNASNLILSQINWGHYSSPDLITWTEHKPALTPEPGYDENGIWSGHVVISDAGIATIIYTAGGKHNGIALAFPKDSTLTEWIKYENNPVIKGQPDGYTRTDLRDTYVFKEAGKWYMVVGFGIKEGEVEKGAVLLYRSDDLKKWTFLHTLFEGDPATDNSGVFWEMPLFLKLKDKYILLVNKVPYKGVPALALYWTGNFVGERFVPDHKMPQNLEIVNRLLSPSVAVDKDGLTTAIAIIPDEIGSRAAYENGWTHVYSIPRVWSLENGRICQRPHPSLQKLRMGEAVIPAQTVQANQNVPVSKGVHQLEIEATFSAIHSKRFGLVVGKDETGAEYTKIYYDCEKQEFVVDQTRSSTRAHIPLQTRSGAYALDTTTPVSMHVFIDGSVVEVFINNKDAFTTRIFPQSSSSNIVEVFAEEGSVQLSKTSVWKLRSSKNHADF